MVSELLPRGLIQYFLECVRETVGEEVCRKRVVSILKLVRHKMTDNNIDKYVQPAIPKFDGHYDHWAKLMENFLCSKQYWNLVEHGITKVANGVVFSTEDAKLLEEHKLKDLKIKNYLY